MGGNAAHSTFDTFLVTSQPVDDLWCIVVCFSREARKTHNNTPYNPTCLSSYLFCIVLRGRLHWLRSTIRSQKSFIFVELITAASP